MSYSAGASSGNLVLLSSQNASGATKVEFKSVITTAYDDYVLNYSGATASAESEYKCYYSTDNGVTYLNAANYAWAGWDCNTIGQSFSNATGQTYLRIGFYLGATAAEQSAGIVQFFNISSGSYRPVHLAYSQCSNGNNAAEQWNGFYAAAIAVNAFKIEVASGTMTGKFKLYGVQK